MRALLLAAGLGTRLRPITNTIPKCMVPIHDRPLLGIWLDRLFAAGIEHVVVNTHYLPDPVQAFLDDHPRREDITRIHEPELLGTGGTLLNTRHLFKDEPVMVIHADNFSTMDIAAFCAAHQQRPATCAMTMALFDTDAPETCGIVTTDASGVAQEFHEKVANPPGTLANAAVYIFEGEIFERCARLNKDFVDLSTEIIPGLLGQIYTHRITGYHRDIGSPAALAQVHADIPASDLDAILAEQ